MTQKLTMQPQKTKFEPLLEAFMTINIQLHNIWLLYIHGPLGL